MWADTLEILMAVQSAVGWDKKWDWLRVECLVGTTVIAWADKWVTTKVVRLVA